MRVFKFSGLQVLALLAVALTGCVGKVREPKVTLADVRVAGIGLRGATLIADLSVKNPNDFTIETDSVVYLFEASDPSGTGTYSPVTRGAYTQRVQVKSGGTTKVEIPVEFNYTSMNAAVASILNKGTFNYRLTGDVYVREPLKRTIPFSRNGNVSLAGAH